MENDKYSVKPHLALSKKRQGLNEFQWRMERVAPWEKIFSLNFFSALTSQLHIPNPWAVRTTLAHVSNRHWAKCSLLVSHEMQQNLLFHVGVPLFPVFMKHTRPMSLTQTSVFRKFLCRSVSFCQLPYYLGFTHYLHFTAKPSRLPQDQSLKVTHSLKPNSTSYPLMDQRDTFKNSMVKLHFQPKVITITWFFCPGN